MTIRIGITYSFLEISVECYNETIGLRNQLNEIISEGGEWLDNSFYYKRQGDFNFISDKLSKETVKSVIFLATFLEAYIYDYSGSHLGDKFSMEHLDKLSLTSKWIVIPKLITGKEINQSKAFFSKLKELVKWRNRLIHDKSQDALFLYGDQDEEGKILITDKKVAEILKPIYEQFNIKDYFQMLINLFDELDKIDGEGYHKQRLNIHLENMK